MENIYCVIAGDNKDPQDLFGRIFERIPLVKSSRNQDRCLRFGRILFGYAHGIGAARLDDRSSISIYDDESVAVIWDGELFNKNRQTEGFRACGKSGGYSNDPAIAARLYLSYGNSCFNKLDGIFAGLIYDKRKNHILAFRSRFGSKELYYAKIGNDFVISTNIYAILRHPGFFAEVNRTAIHEYLAFRSLAGGETMVKHMSKVLPAHYISIDSNLLLDNNRYWDIYDMRTGCTIKDEQECMTKIERILSGNIISEMNDCRNVAIELSGGLDSSLLLALASRSCHEKIKTFSVGFDSNDYEDLRYARMAAEKCGSEHNEIVVGSIEYADEFKNAIHMYKQPLKHPNTVAQYLLYKHMARHGITKSISGTGSDTLFGGLGVIGMKKYFFLKKYLPVRSLGPLPYLLKNKKIKKLDCILKTTNEDLIILSRAHNDLGNSASLLKTVQADALLIARRRHLEELRGETDLLQKDFFYAFRPNMFSSEEFVLAQNMGIMPKTPFLDYEIMGIATRIPANLKIKNGIKKYLIRRLAEPLVPEEILRRPKMGLPVPLERWFRQEKGLGSLLDILLDDRTRKHDIFDMAFLNRIVSEHRESVADWSGLLWVSLSFELWYRIFLEGDGDILGKHHG